MTREGIRVISSIVVGVEFVDCGVSEVDTVVGQLSLVRVELGGCEPCQAVPVEIHQQRVSPGQMVRSGMSCESPHLVIRT